MADESPVLDPEVQWLEDRLTRQDQQITALQTMLERLSSQSESPLLTKMMEALEKLSTSNESMMDRLTKLQEKMDASTPTPPTPKPLSGEADPPAPGTPPENPNPRRVPSRIVKL